MHGTAGFVISNILIFFFVFSIQGAPTNLISLLRNRETVGHTDKRRLKNSVACREYPEAIKKLRKIDKWEDFSSFPGEIWPDPLDSFEDNSLMTAIPAALAGKNQKFKNDVLENTLSGYVGILTKRFIVALVEAGADPNFLPNSKFPYWKRITALEEGIIAMEDIDYCEALLARGANPNIATGWQEFETHTPLVWVRNPALARLMIEYGADVKAVSSKSKKTFLHIASEDNSYGPEILQTYIKNGVGVNVKDSSGLTPLECMILNKSHFTGRSFNVLKEKVSILLNNGATYHRTIGLIEEQIRDYPDYGDEYKKVLDMLIAHDSCYMQEAARLRNILLD